MLLPIIIAACDRRVVDVDPSVTSPGMNTPDIYALTTDALDGEPVNLKKYHGQVTLLVNVASECGFTPQYTKLQQLQETWQDKGFTVIAFPCNDFGGQEPGGPQTIEACAAGTALTSPLWPRCRSSQATASRRYMHNCPRPWALRLLGTLASISLMHRASLWPSLGLRSIRTPRKFGPRLMRC